MIPAEAVGAAGRPVAYEATVAASQAIGDDVYALLGWDGLTRILEAAAPYLQAAVWDRAAAAIVDEHGNPVIPTNVDNPYRSPE